MMQFEDIGIKVIPGKRRYATICPECSKDRKKSKAPCLTVNNETGNRWWKCNHCNFSGNLDVLDKYDQVKERSRMPEQEREFTAMTREYIQSRGLSPRLLKGMKVYETTTKNGTLLCFPFFMNVTLVNVKFLNLSWKEGEKMPKWFQLPKDIGTRIIPFGMQDLSYEDTTAGKRKIIITEGEVDCLTWKECGYRNVVSVPQGAPSIKARDFKKEFEWLHDPYVKSVFDDIDIFYLAVDDDEPGKLLSRHLSMILGKEKCRIVRYPVGYKDINEVFWGSKKKDLPPLKKEGVDECYSNIASIPVRGIIKPSDVREEIDAFRRDGFVPGLGCGVKEIDRLYTAKSPHIEFVTGTPGAGKSTYVRWWLSAMTQHNADKSLKWAIFTPENRPVSREYVKHAELLTGKTIRKGQSNSMSDEMCRTALKYIEKHFFVISPDRMNYEKWDGKPIKGSVNTLSNLMRYIE